MEGLNLKGSPQAIDSVDAVQIDSMVSSLRSLLDPLPNSFLPRPSSRQLQFSSKLISLVPIFDSIRQPSYKSIGTTRSLQLLPRLLFNLEISNRGATNFLLFRNFSRNQRSSIEIFFKIFDRNFSSFADSTSFRKTGRLRKFLENVFSGRIVIRILTRDQDGGGTNLRQNNGQKHTEPLASDVRGLI